MARTIHELTPKHGVFIAAGFALLTLCLDAYHARPVLERWFAASEYSSPARTVESRSPSFDNLDVAIETSNGLRTNLMATGGRVRIATMFYAHCPTMCPMVVETLQRIDANLTPTERDKLGVMLVSLDPLRDTPEVLRGFGVDRNISSSRWMISRTGDSDVGRVARTLGISYENEMAGTLDHTPDLVLLDARGHELARTDKLDAPSAEFMSAVRQAIAADART
jgi:protein SCO1/2